jgi:hypothetical protein
VRGSSALHRPGGRPVIELTGNNSLGKLLGRKLEADNARALAETRGQGTRTDQQGNSSQKLLRRIARTKTKPEILERYEKGEFKSANAAGG